MDDVIDNLSTRNVTAFKDVGEKPQTELPPTWLDHGPLAVNPLADKSAPGVANTSLTSLVISTQRRGDTLGMRACSLAAAGGGPTCADNMSAAIA